MKRIVQQIPSEPPKLDQNKTREMNNEKQTETKSQTQNYSQDDSKKNGRGFFTSETLSSSLSDESVIKRGCNSEKVSVSDLVGLELVVVVEVVLSCGVDDVDEATLSRCLWLSEVVSCPTFCMFST